VKILRTTRDWIRLRACAGVVLEAVLGMALESPGIAHEQRVHSVPVIARSHYSSAIQGNWGSERVDHARQRTATDFPFLLAPVDSHSRDAGRLIAGIPSTSAGSLDTLTIRSGRSPPLAVS